MVMEVDVIARVWRASASPANGECYSRHFATTVVPHLQTISGHEHAYLLRRELADGRWEFVAITFWQSLDSIKAFTGPDPEVAIVDPDARSMLSDFDHFAGHFVVAYRPSDA